MTKLAEGGIDEAYLSLDEMWCVVTQANDMNQVDDIVRTLRENRANSYQYNTSNFPKSKYYTNALARIFPWFNSTEFIFWNKDDEAHILRINPNKLSEAKNLLLIPEIRTIKDFNDSSEWQKYNGVN